MNSIYFDPAISDDARRALLYEGQLVVVYPCAESLLLCEFAREMLK